VTLREAIDTTIAAYDEDEGEREAILAALVPVLVDDKALAYLIGLHWTERADEIREALAAYHVERAEIDAEAAADDLASEDA
jgi:hypothetical protein